LKPLHGCAAMAWAPQLTVRHLPERSANGVLGKDFRRPSSRIPSCYYIVNMFFLQDGAGNRRD
jgi:hypothetical protein